MMKQIRNLGAMALLAATLVVGCSDSVIDTAGTDAAAAYDVYDAMLLDETQMTTYGEVPDNEQELMDSTRADSLMCSLDSLRGGGPGGKGRPGRGGHDGRGHHGRGHGGSIDNIAPLGIRSYRAAASQFGLSAGQDSLFRVYLAALRDCAGSAATSYRAARQTAFAPYRTRIDSIRAAVKGGTITREEAKAQLDAIRAEFEAVIAPLNEQLRTEVSSCRSTFEAAVEAMLTAEQRDVWLTLK
jgi:hypothetical protein